MEIPSWYRDSIVTWTEHPAQMARELFNFEPDKWQEEGLEAFPLTKRMAFKACAGPGKTAVLALLGWNFMITKRDCMIGATSITGPNLSANLWTELARWRSKAPLLESLFEQTSKLIFYKERPRTWKMEARTWSADADANQIGNALRGVHADYVMWLLDETGDYPDAIMPICESIFAGSPKEAHIVQAGNPLKKSGPLYRATMAPNLWKTIQITADPDDPMRTPRVSVEHARQMIAEYGRDNPWIRVTIFGQFPDADFNALIGLEECIAATKRVYRLSDIESSAKVLGVDVGREGDDPSVICPRQGLQMFKMDAYRNIDGIQGGAQVNRKWTDWGADAAFVDNTGGFGSSWVDQLRVLCRTPVPINFSQEAHDKTRFYNKRSEMAMDLVAWIRRGGAIPNHDEFIKALTQTNYAFKADRMIIEPKDAVKKKLGFSPDHFDAAILTMAEPVLPKQLARAPQPMQAEYDPFASLNQRVQDAVGNAYDPFGGSR
jgi:hypothetical protein